MLRVLDSLPPELDWRLAVFLCLVFLLAGIAVIVRFRRAQSTGGLSDKGKLLELPLNNMPQGVVMFDAKARLVVCNDRYLKIYDLPPNIVKPGARLADIVRLRAKSGSLPDDPNKQVASSWKSLRPERSSASSPNCPTGAPLRSSIERSPAARTGSE